MASNFTVTIEDDGQGTRYRGVPNGTGTGQATSPMGGSVKMKRLLADDVESGVVNQDEDLANVSTTMASKRLIFAIKAVIGIVFMILVLGCSVLSKLTLVSLTDKLRNVTYYPNSTKRDNADSDEDKTTAVTLYWYLQFVLLIPNFITLIRCLAFGVIGKTTKTFPWPKGRYILLGMAGAVTEVLAMTSFVYLVLPEISPGVGILLLCGVFFFQICVDIVKTPNWYCGHNTTISCGGPGQRNGYNEIQRQRVTSSFWSKPLGFLEKTFRVLLANRIAKVVALLLQIIGMFGFIGLWVGMTKDKHYDMVRPMVGYPLVIFALSVIWSNFFQEKIAGVEDKYDKTRVVTARFKSSFINSGLRLLLYPFVSYVIFRYAFPIRVDPWCLHGACHITLKGSELPVMIVQVVATFVGYVVGWVACTMILSRLSFAIPLLLSTPVTILWYYITTYHFNIGGKVFPKFTIGEERPFGEIDKYIPILASLLWFGEIIAMLYFLSVKTNIILSSDSEMFLTPHYDGVFFEQYMILNRQTRKYECYKDSSSGSGESIQLKPRKIFICSTMYRENEIEMKQMLCSIFNLADEYAKQKRDTVEGGICDEYESHIFFDGAINGTQILEFGLQLLSLLKDIMTKKSGHEKSFKSCLRQKTPYGYRLTWGIGAENMQFTVHFKDKLLVKPKKRWSQVMYMNYVIKHRIREEDADADNTFILTTDADIDFTPQSANVLLDMLAADPQVGAVCARTHPKGSGPVYWYQVFDYAIGHWFQKPAEHILGCVLCSPGCFSVFRCSALEKVMEEYSSEAIGAGEFLMKDMGEDRWLCTLLIKAGWRLEYCAISEDQTYCPTEFGEFFKQRRRWIPSTIANLGQLISEAGSITRRNDSVSILFILFQAIMVFSTAISPATVILVISSGLQSAFKLSPAVTLAIISVLVIVSVLYGLVCLYASPQTQLDMAKLLTFIFAIIMSLVIVGIFKDTVYNIWGGKHQSVLKPSNCEQFNTTETTNSTGSDKDYEDCLKAAKYIEGLANSLWKPDVLIPVSTTTIYLGAFAVTFLVAAILHLPEWYCLLHCVWYLLALPSGYLLLLIYSAANLDSQSWGTREGSSGKDKGLVGWLDHLKKWWKKCIACCMVCCRRNKATTPEEKKKFPDKVEPKPDDASSSSSDRHSPSPEIPAVDVKHQSLKEECKTWLTELECLNYEDNFEEHGYVNEHFIAAMKPQDFEAIGINKRGFRLRLQKAAKKLPSLPIYTEVPKSVEQWLERLEIPEYAVVFHKEGYKTAEDIENLKDLTEKDLRAMGIAKRAHLQRLRVGIDNLVKPTPLELRIRHTETLIDNLMISELKNTDKAECDFWTDLIHRTLKPVSVRFQGQIQDMKDSLRSLRNTALGVILLVNIMWIVLLYTLQFPELEDYGLDSRGFQVLFLFVYGFIIIVQFITLLCHRIVTLMHYLGRIQPYEVMRRDREDSEDIEFVRTGRYGNGSSKKT